MQQKKILIVSHGHPDVHKGGGEIAAFQLFQHYESLGHDVLLVARSAEPPHGGAAFSVRNASNQLLFHTTQHDDFLFSNLRTRYMWGELRELIERFAPQVVHFHHFFLVGIEALLVARRAAPEARIILTLHEYLAICHHHGLMIKRPNHELCYKASPKDCHRCFPEKSPADFFMRELYIKRAFAVVDTFVAPSHFLKQRYVDWGLEADDIVVIENGLPLVATLPPAAEVSRKHPVIQLAYIGQINRFKGLDVLLEALLLLDEDARKQFALNIHGVNLEEQPEAFRDKVSDALEELSHCAFLHGGYENQQLPQLLAHTDWVVVPSIWWENSPLVIQEAFRSRVPVIASDIGGMAEKVQHNVNGLLFMAGKPLALSRLLYRLIDEPDLHAQCQSGITPPLSIAETAQLNLSLY